ncbi:MAG: glycosyltransferase family 2 protein [Sphingomonadaceae bacterium]
MTDLVDIVIVNWNSGKQLAECLQSIDACHGGLVASVTVVDNGSTDQSADVGCHDVPFQTIRVATNLGFARACNLGARQGWAKYILLLNPDARLEAQSLAVPLRVMADEESVAVAGIRLLDEDGRAHRHCARIPRARDFLIQALALHRIWPRRFPGFFMEEFDHLSTRDVDHVIGAFYLVRRDVWELLGGFDERFFVYLEDLDFSRRVRTIGYRVRYLAEASAFHRGGGTSRQVMGRRLSYSLGSRLLYSGKHFSWPGAAAVVLATLGVEPVLRLADQMRSGNLAGVGQVVEGYARLYASLPSLVARAIRSHRLGLLASRESRETNAGATAARE